MRYRPHATPYDFRAQATFAAALEAPVMAVHRPARTPRPHHAARDRELDGMIFRMR